MAGFGALIIVFSAVWDIGVRPIFFVSAAPQITQKILQLYPSGTPVALMGVSVIYESQVRVLSGGRLNPTQLPLDSTQTELEKFPLLVYAKQDFERNKLDSGTVIATITGIGGWRVRDFRAIIFAPRKKEQIWASRREEYYLVRPPTSHF